MTENAICRVFVRPVFRLSLWIAWGLLIIAFSYKRKALGEEGIRPLYLPGIALEYILLVWLAVKCKRLRWTYRRGWLELCLIGMLYGLVGYIVLQSAFYPESFRPQLYTTGTAFLIFTLAILSVLNVGWNNFILIITQLYLFYGLINVMLVLSQYIWPDWLNLLLVPFNESGFGKRISGLPGDPTHLGSFLAIAILLWFVQRKSLSFWWLPVVTVLLAALIATGSRNAALSLLVGSTVSILVGWRGKWVSLLKLYVSIISLGLLTVWAFSITRYGFDFLEYVYRVGDPNAYSRTKIWQDVFGLTDRLPFANLMFGSGYLFIQDIYGSPYNAFIKTFFNHGLLFLAVFLLAIAGLCFLGLKDRNVVRRQTFFALLAYWFCFSMFLDTAFAEFFHSAEFCFWLAAALALTSRIGALGVPQTHANGS